MEKRSMRGRDSRALVESMILQEHKAKSEKEFTMVLGHRLCGLT